MHGLWNNIKSSVEGTLETILSSPQKLRKSHVQHFSVFERSGLSDKESQGIISKKFEESSIEKVKLSSQNSFCSTNETKALSLRDSQRKFNAKMESIESINATNVSSSGHMSSSDFDESNIPNAPIAPTTDNNFENQKVLEREETSCSVRSNGSTAEQTSVGSWTACQNQSGVLSSVDTNFNPESEPCHNIGDYNRSEKSAMRLTGSSDFRKAKPKVPTPRRMNTLGVIDIELTNDEGENDSVEIDIADTESIKEEEKYLPNARRQSISDRINRRRTSELAAEIIRLSAEHRKREFFDLINEHEEIVKSIDIWKKTGIFPPPKSSNKSKLETVEDEDDSDDILDEEPEYFRRTNENNSSFLMSNKYNQDNKENKTLPRSH